MSRRPRIGLLLFVLSWAPASIGATMYKCQAPDGRVTYMDQPCPPGNVTEKRIEPAAAPPAPAAKEPSREAVPPSPYRRPQPVVVPPLPPPPDLSRFPKDSKGRPIIAGNSNYALVIDDDAKMQPVNVISACGELITGCVKPSERSLDACFMSVPRCASARPWEDPAYKPCCPAQCWTQYEERRIAGMKGPDARVHYEYHAKHHSAAFVGDKVVVTGHIVDKYVKRGRPYLWYYLEVKTADGRLVTTYNDLTVLRYKVEGDR